LTAVCGALAVSSAKPAADRGFVLGAGDAHEWDEAGSVGGADRVLDGAGVRGGVFGVEHDEVEAREAENLNERVVGGEALHAQRHGVRLDHA
jgi:hypothetical protein